MILDLDRLASDLMPWDPEDYRPDQPPPLVPYFIEVPEDVTKCPAPEHRVFE